MISPSQNLVFADDAMYMESNDQDKVPLLQFATALAASFLICKAAQYFTKLSGIQGGILPAVTAIIVILATLLPRQIGSLGPAGHNVALVLMQVAKSLKIFFYCFDFR